MMSWTRCTSLSRRWIVAVTVMALLGGCGESGPAEPVPDPEIEPFVGTWAAVEFVLTSVADPAVQFDILEGGSFTIVVEPSGQYTATLGVEGLPVPSVEFGQLTVEGATLTLAPDGGPIAVSTYVFDGPDRVTLEGPTEFDVNRDGEADDVTALIVLMRD